MGRPVPDHKHLHGGRSVPGDGEERAERRGGVTLLVARAEVDFAGVDGDGFVDGSGTGGGTFDLKSLRREIESAAKGRGKGNGMAAVDELEVNLHCKGIGVAPDFVGL